MLRTAVPCLTMATHVAASEVPAPSVAAMLVGEPRKPDAKSVAVDSIGISGPASAVEVSGNLRFDSRTGSLDPDGSLVRPVPVKAHVLSP